jgi:hypothetical protein
MQRVVKAVAKLAIAFIVGSILEGCILRDPWVELGNGYNIGAISWSSPCHLTYMEPLDQRPPATWIAWRTDSSFTISNRDTDEIHSYENEEAWRRGIRKLGARRPGATLLDQVTGFNNGDRYAIGHSNGGGFFLLDKEADELDTWPTEDGWIAAVQTRTTLDPNIFLDPKAWRHQYRHTAYWVIMGSFAALVLAWIVVPLLPGLERYDVKFTRRGDW